MVKAKTNKNTHKEKKQQQKKRREDNNHTKEPKNENK